MAKTDNKKAAKQPLSRKKVLKKAIKLADQHGVDALSMRKLALALNVEAMSLYNYVKNKEDLLDGMVETVVAEFELPNSDKHWREALRASVIHTHQVLLKHPWAAGLLISRIMIGDAMLTYSNASIGCLYDAGFSHAMTDHGWNAIQNHLYGFTLTKVNAPVHTEEYSQAAKQYLPMVPADKYPHIRAMMEVIIAGEHSGVNDFEFGLDLILGGLERGLGA